MADTRAVTARRALAVLAAVALAGCGAPRGPQPGIAAPGPRVAVAGDDYRRPGPQPVRTQDGAVASHTGCRVDYTVYRPARPAGERPAVLAHGFLRGRDTLDGLARHLASWGVTAVAVEFCNSSLLAGRHADNARDLVAVARALRARAVAYGGISAGGLSALLAAAADGGAQAVLALDLVDGDGLGAAAAPRVHAPVYALLGEAGACNAQRNALAVYARLARVEVLALPGAGHCDFEQPTGALCEAACGTRLPAGAGVDAVLRGLATAALLPGPAGAEAAARWWRRGGENRGRLAVAGLVGALD